jgi:hypothetical protein
MVMYALMLLGVDNCPQAPALSTTQVVPYGKGLEFAFSVTHEVDVIGEAQVAQRPVAIGDKSVVVLPSFLDCMISCRNRDKPSTLLLTYFFLTY